MRRLSLKEMEDHLSPELESLRAENAMLKSLLKEQKRLSGDMSEIVRQVCGAAKSVRPPRMVYVKGKVTAVGSPCPLVVHLTDLHIGLQTNESETEGFGKYNYAIAESRMMTFQKKLIDWASVMRHSYTIDEVVVLGTGDWTCFPEDAEVVLESGIVKRIKDIRVGDRVASQDGFGTVDDIHIRDADLRDEIFTVKAIKSLPLEATGDHVVAVLPKEKVEVGWNPGGKKGRGFVVREKDATETDIEWRKVKDLRVGDYLMSQRWRPTTGSMMLDLSAITKLPIETCGRECRVKVRGTNPAIVGSRSIEITPRLLRVLGLFLAEGSFSRGRSGRVNVAQFTFGISEKKLADEVVSFCKDVFGYTPSVRLCEKANSCVVNVCNPIIANLFFALCGEYADIKAIASPIWEAPCSLLPLVQGWLDGDGCYGYCHEGNARGIIGKTISRNLAEQMVTICHTEGLNVGLALSPRCGRNRGSYSISFTGEAAQRIAAGSYKYDPYSFRPTYEDGIEIGDWYAHRITSLAKSPPRTKLYDLTISPRPYYQVSGFVVHNSGDIHEDLIRTNEFPCPVQAVKAGYLVGEFLHGLAPHFKTVRCEFITMGNHDRLTRKPQANQGGENSWGFIVGSIAKEYIKRCPNVVFNVYPKMQQVVDVAGWKYLIGHGSGIVGTWGIPYYGIERRKQREAMARMNMPLDKHFHKIVIGHFHSAVNHEHWLIGGSLSGTTSDDHVQGRHSPPHQTAWVAHHKWGEFAWTRFWL